MARWFVRSLSLALTAISGVFVMLVGAPSFASGTSLTGPLGANLSKQLDALAGRWVSVGSMAQSQSNPFAIRLRGGRVLVGGWDRSPQLYSPRANTWVRTGRLHYGSDGAGSFGWWTGASWLSVGGRRVPPVRSISPGPVDGR
jgi:hypothetical protein